MTRVAAGPHRCGIFHRFAHWRTPWAMALRGSCDRWLPQCDPPMSRPGQRPLKPDWSRKAWAGRCLCEPHRPSAKASSRLTTRAVAPFVEPGSALTKPCCQYSHLYPRQTRHGDRLATGSPNTVARWVSQQTSFGLPSRVVMLRHFHVDQLLTSATWSLSKCAMTWGSEGKVWLQAKGSISEPGMASSTCLHSQDE